MNEKIETATREWSDFWVESVENGYVVTTTNDVSGEARTYVFGSRIELASWIASEMPRSAWEKTLG